MSPESSAPHLPRRLEGRWLLAPEPDGIVRLRNGGATRALRTLGCLAVAFIAWLVGGFALLLLFPSRAGVPVPFTPSFWRTLINQGPTFTTPLTCWTLLICAALAAFVFLWGETEWRVGPNLLEEHRRRRGRLSFCRRHSEGRLVIRMSPPGKRPCCWSLDVISEAGTATLDSTQESDDTTHGSLLEEEPYRVLESLGKFLSQQTGWPLTR